MSVAGAQPRYRGVLFDLDGTLADTAPDLGGALNDLCARYDRPLVAMSGCVGAPALAPAA